MSQDKEYLAKIHLGITTDSYDSDGQILTESSIVPSLYAIEEALQLFQGTVLQTPPMFSAKKMNGKKLYDLARKGIEVERQPVAVNLNTELVSYSYPILALRVSCSKGTYIRSIAHDLGRHLGCGAHLAGLMRTRSGSFNLKDCWNIEELQNPEFNFAKALRAEP
jgi:tRNA pseudouridine55 synthase